MVYGSPWDEARVSADNPMEHIENYRGKRIFLVCGTDPVDQNEKHVLPTQRTFGGALAAAGIPHERYERGRPPCAPGAAAAGYRRHYRPSDQGRLRAFPSFCGP